MHKLTIIYGEVEESVPAKWAICSDCRGEGHHGNPAFDGLSVDYFREDPEFFEGYLAGRYDVRCSACDGSGKVLVLDEDAATPDQVAAYWQSLREDAENRAIERSELRMGF